MSINSTTVTFHSAHLNGDGYSYIGDGEINGKRIKDVYLLNTDWLNTDWYELFQIFEKNGEMNDVCIENGQIVTDPKRKAEIKENAKKQIAQDNAMDDYEDAMDDYEDAREEYEDAIEERRKSMRKMNADMQNMRRRLPMFYTMQPLWRLHHPFGGAAKKYANNFKVKKKEKPFKLITKYKPKANYPKTDGTRLVDVSYKPTINIPLPEEARQIAFDNLLSTLKKDLEPDQFATYSSLVKTLRKSPNGDPDSIAGLYNSMFQGEKEIYTQETFPQKYIIKNVHDKLNDTANKSKNTINNQKESQRPVRS